MTVRVFSRHPKTDQRDAAKRGNKEQDPQSVSSPWRPRMPRLTHVPFFRIIIKRLTSQAPKEAIHLIYWTRSFLRFFFPHMRHRWGSSSVPLLSTYVLIVTVAPFVVVVVVLFYLLLLLLQCLLSSFSLFSLLSFPPASPPPPPPSLARPPELFRTPFCSFSPIIFFFLCDCYFCILINLKINQIKSYWVFIRKQKTS